MGNKMKAFIDIVNELVAKTKQTMDFECKTEEDVIKTISRLDTLREVLDVLFKNIHQAQKKEKNQLFDFSKCTFIERVESLDGTKYVVRLSDGTRSELTQIFGTDVNGKIYILWEKKI